jgi:negative regulator of flagellin synthesis FlgM
MRIEAYNQVQQLYRSQRVNKNQKTTKTTFADQVQISSIGKDIQTAKAAVKASPDVRAELTGPIKEKIQNGTYSVDTSSFAEKLIQKYEEMR